MSQHQVLSMFQVCVTVCLVFLVPCYSAATGDANVGMASRRTKDFKDYPEQLVIVPSMSSGQATSASGTRKASQGGDVPFNNALQKGGDASTRKHNPRIMSNTREEEQKKTNNHPRPVRSPQQGTDPLPLLPEAKMQNGPMDQQMGYYGEIIPTLTIDQRGTEYESPAEQRDDELEEKLDMLRQRYGYMNSVLPENMSMYPDIMNYTEPAEEAEEVEEAGEAGEQEEQGEYEPDEHLMSASANISHFGREDAEYEADEGLQPSEELRPYKVHNMSSMASDIYDPYYNYGYQYRPKKDKPAQEIQPTPAINGASKFKDAKIAGLASAGANGTTGTHAKITDVKTITQKKKLADFGGMSASATFGIVVGTIIGFWLVMGPLICLLMKVRDHHKDKQKRFMLAPRHGKDKSDNGIMEAMIMTELGKLSLQSKKKYTAVRNPAKTPDRQSLTDDKDLDTFHDAFDTPSLLP